MDRRAEAWTLAAFVFAAFCLFAWLGRLPLIDPDEGRNASVAREMQLSGAWLIPSYDGLAYLDKPAFYFRTVALSFSAFGESQAAARFSSAVFAFALLGMVWYFCRHEYGWRTAALAVPILATTPLFLALGRFVTLDMSLSLFLWAAIFCGYVAEQKRGRARTLWYLGSAAAAGVAGLVKGPVGVALPAAVLMLFAVGERRSGAIARILAPQNFAVFLAIVLPWFLGVIRARPDFFHYSVVEETFQRFATPALRRTGPFYYYVPVIAGLFFPWSVLLPGSLLAGWRARHRSLPADRLLATAVVIIVAFFSAAQSKLPSYILPALVALGILAARIFDLAWRMPSPAARGEGASKIVWVAAPGEAPNAATRLVLHSALLLAATAALIAALLAVDVLHLGNLAALLHVRAAGLEHWRGFFAPVMWTFTGAALAAVAAWLRSAPRAVFAVFLCFPVALVFAVSGPLSAYAEASSSLPLARHVQAVAPGSEVLFLECFAPGMPYYLQRDVYLATLDGHETTSNYINETLVRNPAWPGVMIRPEQLAGWLAAQKQPVYLMARAEQFGQINTLAAARGATVEQIEPGWWGALLPPARANDPGTAPNTPNASAEAR